MNRSRRLTAIAIVTAIVTVTVGCIGWIMLQHRRNNTAKDLSSFQVEAQGSNSYGILEETSFLITCDTSFRKADVEHLISLEPATDYTLTNEGDGQYLLTPKQPLAINTLYNVTVGDTEVQQFRSWAFQTQRSVGVLSTHPGDGNTYSDTNTGIEFSLSHKGLNIAEHFSIEPATAGHWEYYNRTAVFVPESPLAENTLYTITLSAGMKSNDDIVMQDPFTFKFRTRSDSDGKGGSIYRVGSIQETFTTFDPPLVELSTYGLGDTPVAHTLVYRLGVDGYLSILNDYSKFVNEELGRDNAYVYDAQAAGLTPEATLDIVPNGSANGWGNLMYALPSDLGVGYYMVDLTIDPVDGTPEDADPLRMQKLIQITDTSLYNYSTPEQSLFWFNNASTGAAQNGLTVEISEKMDFTDAITAQTDADGLATIATPQAEEEQADDGYWENEYYLRVTNQSDEILYTDLIATPISDTYTELRDRYHTMLYIDRNIYQPTDEISFWGVMRPRTNGEELPKKIWAKVLTTGYDGDTVTLASTELTLGSDGTFSGKMPFEQVVSSWYEVIITDTDGTEYEDSYATENFSIQVYQKPEYVVTVEPDRRYYSPGEMVNFAINTSFYEGTPATGLTYMLTAEGQTVQDIKTDHNGDARASFTLPDKAAEREGYTPYVTSYDLTSTGAEDDYQSIYDNMLVIPRNVLAEIEVDENGADSYDLHFKTNKVDPSKILPEEEIWNYTGYALRGDKVDVPLKAQIYRVDMIRTITGTYYDFINKETHNTYEYSQQETLEKEYNLRTTDGVATLENLTYVATNDFYYYVKVTGVDLNNRSFEYRRNIGYLNLYNMSQYDGGYKKYLLISDQDEQEEYYQSSYVTLAEDDAINLSLYENGKLTQNNGRLLYIPVQKEMMSVNVTTQATISTTFTAECIPNMEIYAAYFDGKHIYAIPSASIVLDSATKELAMAVTTDQEQYLPGDTVKATVTLTHQDGTPAASDFALSVVDEAVFAISPQNYDAAADLYSSINVASSRVHVSYVQYISESGSNPDTAGGKGGGGGDGGGYTRQTFVDTAFFTSGSTNRNGVAEVSFTLPDNLTSWRLTTVAVSDDLLAQSEIINISASQPFFVQPIVTKLFLTGDDVTFTARARGRADFAPEKVAYTVDLMQGEKKLGTMNATGDVGSFNFGALPAGEYNMTVSAASGELSDAVSKDFTVSDSGFEMPVVEPLDPSAALSSTRIARYPVTITFFDSKYTTYTKAMDVLLSSYGKRIDQRVARLWAQEQLAAQNPDLPSYFEEIDISDLSYDGGVSLMPYGDVDHLLTGKFCVAAPQYMDIDRALRILENTIKSTDAPAENVVGSYLGLAALKKPVLNDLRSLVDDPSFTDEERVYLIAALGYIGDQQTAQAAYDRYVAPQIVRENEWAYLPKVSNEDSRDLTFEATTRALLAATSIGHSDATLLAEYLCANPSSKTLSNLELMAYLRTFDLKNDVSGKFSYVDSQGKKQTVDLSKERTYTTAFTKEGLENSDVQVLKGDVGATAYYIGLPAEMNLMPIEGVTVNKTVANTNGSSLYVPGDLVTVTVELTFDDYAPAGYYSLADYVPSGLRFVKMLDGGGKGYAPYGDASCHLQSFEGQNLAFGVYYTPEANVPLDDYYDTYREEEEDFVIIEQSDIEEANLISDPPAPEPDGITVSPEEEVHPDTSEMDDSETNTNPDTSDMDDPETETNPDTSSSPNPDTSSSPNPDTSSSPNPDTSESLNPDISGNPGVSNPTAGKAGPTTIVVNYTARCVLPGQYRVDSAYLTQEGTGHVNFTLPFSLTVGEVGESSAPQIKLVSSFLPGVI